MTFELPLTEVRVKPHQVTALHLMAALVMAGTGAVLALAITPLRIWAIAVLIAGIMLLGATLFRNRWLRQPRINRLFRIGELMILLCLASYFAINGFTIPAIMCGALGAATMLALFWEQPGNSSLTVKIDEAGVRLPVTSRRRHLSWPEIEQVLLRFGFLTVNCHDNRLYQWPIGTIEFNKTAFEDFCNTCIEEGKLKRVSEDEW